MPDGTSPRATLITSPLKDARLIPVTSALRVVALYAKRVRSGARECTQPRARAGGRWRGR